MERNFVNSKNYKTWVAVMDGKTCIECKNLNGKIYSMYEILYPQHRYTKEEDAIQIILKHFMLVLPQIKAKMELTGGWKIMLRYLNTILQEMMRKKRAGNVDQEILIKWYRVKC